MTQVITYKGRAFSITLLLIIGVLAILLWWKSCGGGHVDNPSAIAKLQKESEEMYTRLTAQVKSVRDSAKELQGEKELADSMLSDAAHDLKKMFEANEKLRKQHDKEPAPIPFDSNSAIVSNRWIAQCDTCFMLNKRMEDSVRAAKRIVDKLGEIHQKQLSLKDEEIDLNKTALIEQRQAFNDLLNKYAKLGKGKASLSAGIEYNYSPAVSEVGAYATFRTRKGHEVGIGAGGNTLSSYYFSVRMGAKIF